MARARGSATAAWRRAGRVAFVAAASALLLLPLAAADAKKRLKGPAPPLSHEGRWITDAKGRVVILHGFNMVYKVGSYRPADTGFGADDARFLRRNGFNTVRLGIIYKGFEPDPPAAGGAPSYRTDYLDSIAATEQELARRGIFSLLDFHQDLYNERFEGEGWPDWQTIDDGLPAEPKNGFPANYLTMPALNRAFDHFWANDPASGVPLQDAYALAWREVARRFREHPYVMGYDLLNEPWPGSAYPSCVNPAGCPAFDATVLTEFSKRVITRIREVDPDTLAFYEPLLTFDFGALTSHGDTGDPRAGFSFHNYCLPAAFGGGGTDEACAATEDLVYGNADAHSAATGDALFLTEFGASDDLEDTDRVVDLAARHMVSWQYWHYCDCQDPTTSGPGVQSLVIDPSQPPTGANVKQEKLAVLARPYPQTVAGTPLSYSFDNDSRVFELAYSTEGPHGDRLRRKVKTHVFVPDLHYPDGYRAEVSGARVVSKPDARRLVLRRARNANEVELTLIPR